MRPIGRDAETLNPGSGESLGKVAQRCGGRRRGGRGGKARLPGVARRRAARAHKILRRSAEVLRKNARTRHDRRRQLRQPGREMASDAMIAAAQIDFFAGLVTEMKGASVPMGPGVVNFRCGARGVVRASSRSTIRSCSTGKSAAPLAAGNTVVMKPPYQAPLSACAWPS